MQRVGFIGLGIMGSGMVRNLSKKGVPVTVWNRSPERAAGLGVEVPVARSPRELAQDVDVIVCCVSNPQAVEQVVFGAEGVLAGARAGLRYVECSTVSPELVRRLAKAFSERGAGFLEAPVTGSKNAAENGTLLFMSGGPAELNSELEPLLLKMGSRVIHCGENGQGALMKLAGNTLIAFMLEGLCEAMTVATKGGLSPEKILEVIAASGFASPYYAFKGNAIRERNFETHFSVDLLVKDLTLMLQEAATQPTAMPGLAAIREQFQTARALGLGERDIAAVIQTLESTSRGR
ncbi:MAG TPA: NAD(P)-dependent oxidoreductase [Polyangiaceae bacterium]|nr:NAD(P)-dependent oxidoreductase [Polyangiaceae bacterium]